MKSMDDLIREKKKAPEAGEEVDMYVDCQHCDEEIHGPKFHRNEHLLVWKCSLGHRSYLENFKYE